MPKKSEKSDTPSAVASGRFSRREQRATIVIDAPNREIITVTVFDGSDVVAVREIPYDGPVDSRLLTAIDNMFNEHILDRFVFFDVSPGKGVDTASILYRIIATLSAALERTG